MSRSPLLHERFFCAPGRTLMVALHPFCSNKVYRARKKVRQSKTGAPLRLGIRPCPTNVGTVGAPQCFFSVLGTLTFLLVHTKYGCPFPHSSVQKSHDNLSRPHLLGASYNHKFLDV